MKKRGGQTGARLGIMLMLALMLLMQSLTLQASVQMLPDHPPAMAHAMMGCDPKGHCDGVDDVKGQPDCCIGEYQHHCGSGSCSVALPGLISVSPPVPVQSNTQPESDVAPLLTTLSIPPSPPPKAC